MREFDVSLHRNTMGRKPLILVLLEDIGKLLNLTGDCSVESLKQYVRSHTFVEYNSSDYQGRLLYAMPVTGIGNVCEEIRLNII